MRLDGWIYILSNEAFADGRIKIGCSSKDPNARKEELESSGVPEEFHLEYRALVSSFSLVETKIHKALAAHRPNKNREFFTCSIPTAINTIREIVGEPEIKYEEVLYENSEEIEEEIEEERLYKVLLEQEEQKTIARQAQERVRQEKVKARREEEKAQKAKEAEARTKRLEERAERENQKHRNELAIWLVIIWAIAFLYFIVL